MAIFRKRFERGLWGFLALLPLLIQSAWAGLLSDEKELHACFKPIQTLITHKNAGMAAHLSSDSWQKIPLLGKSAEGGMSYSLPEVMNPPGGVRLEIQAQVGLLRVILSDLTPMTRHEDAQIVYEMDSQSCAVLKKSEEFIVPHSDNTPDTNDVNDADEILEIETSHFDDLELKKLLTQSETGVIYVWSPHMLYSVLGIPVIEEVCQKLKVPLLVLMDSAASDVLVEDAKSTFQVKDIYTLKNESASLSALGSELHFPGVFLYQKGKLRPEILLGIKTSVTYENHIQDSFKSGH